MELKELIEIAQDEAEEIARCFYKFKRKHKDCRACPSFDFCAFLLKKAEEKRHDA